MGEKNTRVIGDQKLFGLQSILFYVQQKKDIIKGLEQLVGV